MVSDAYQRAADAFEVYEEALYDAYDEVTPFVLYEDDDEDDVDEDEGDDEEGDDEDEEPDDLDDHVASDDDVAPSR